MSNVVERFNTKMENDFCKESLEVFREKMSSHYKRTPTPLNGAQKDLMWEESKTETSHKLKYRIWSILY